VCLSVCPLVVQYWADLQSVHGFPCYDNIHVCKPIALYPANACSAEREMSASGCTCSMARAICGCTCGWQVKLCDPSLTRAIPGRLRDKLLSIRRYANDLFTYLLA